VLILHYVQMCW